jgi:hypothetical protein
MRRELLTRERRKKSAACRLCRLRVKDWEGNDPRCAFDSHGAFTTDNWRCATMEALCKLVEVEAVWSQEHALLVLAVPEQLELGGHLIHVVLQRYKHRGKVQAAFAIDDDGRRHSLRVELAAAIVAFGRA